jgi:bacteriocin-like protein
MKTIDINELAAVTGGEEDMHFVTTPRDAVKCQVNVNNLFTEAVIRCPDGAYLAPNQTVTLPRAAPGTRSR